MVSLVAVFLARELVTGEREKAFRKGQTTVAVVKTGKESNP